MKRLIKKTENNSGEKCKTYIYDYKNSIIFMKLTLIPNKNFKNIIGGETIVKETDRYMLTLHCFPIKKETLIGALTQLDLI
jgi:hypothetical protein